MYACTCHEISVCLINYLCRVQYHILNKYVNTNVYYLIRNNSYLVHFTFVVNY